MVNCKNENIANKTIFDDTMQGLLEAVAIKKGAIVLEEKANMKATTFVASQKKHYVSELFIEKPERYGFRGDPFFWDYLKEYFSAKEFLYSIEQIIDDIYQQFYQVSGEQLTTEANPYVQEFAHGGMSSGRLNGEFWITKGIPLLINRYRLMEKRIF